MNKELQKSNAINLNLPAYECWDLYCVDCEKVFDYKDLYNICLEEWECICHECDTIRYDNQNKI